MLFSMILMRGIVVCRMSSLTRRPALLLFTYGLDESGPTENQRDCFNTFRSKYNELWQQIANKLIECHDELHSIDDASNAMSGWVSLHLGEHHETSLELVVDLDLPNEGTRGYFIPIKNWSVGDAVVAD